MATETQDASKRHDTVEYVPFPFSVQHAHPQADPAGPYILWARERGGLLSLLFSRERADIDSLVWFFKVFTSIAYSPSACTLIQRTAISSRSRIAYAIPDCMLKELLAHLVQYSDV